MSIWTRDGMVLTNADGNPIDCAECPCGGRCAEQFASMKAYAESHGHAFHGEGFYIRRNHDPNTGAFGNYILNAGNMGRCACAYETATDIVFLRCDCSTGSVAKAYGSCQDYFAYMEYAGACSCLDEREIAMLYPAEFGIEAIGFGTHLKIRHRSAQSQSWSWRLPLGVPSSSLATYAEELDYRLFSAIYRPYPSGKAFLFTQKAGSAAHVITQLSDIAEFAGYFLPFTYDADFGCRYSGEGRAMWSETMYEYQRFEDADRDAAFAAATAFSRLYDSDVSIYDRQLPDRTPFPFPVPVMDFSMTSHPGFVRDLGEYLGLFRFDAFKGYYAPPGITPLPEYQVPGEGRYCYYLEYIRTNMGILVNGLPSYYPSIHVCGAEDVPQGAYTNQCSMPGYDVTCSVDLDMHWCPGHDPLNEEVP